MKWDILFFNEGNDLLKICNILLSFDKLIEKSSPLATNLYQLV